MTVVVFILGIDIIDWISFIVVIIFQTLMFSVGINFNKRLINYSAIKVYAGMIIFFFGILLSDVKLTSQAFVELLDYKNIIILTPLISTTEQILSHYKNYYSNYKDINYSLINCKALRKIDTNKDKNSITELKYLPDGRIKEYNVKDSDIRLKNVTSNINNSIDIINNLNGFYYTPNDLYFTY